MISHQGNHIHAPQAKSLPDSGYSAMNYVVLTSLMKQKINNKHYHDGTIGMYNCKPLESHSVRCYFKIKGHYYPLKIVRTPAITKRMKHRY